MLLRASGPSARSWKSQKPEKNRAHIMRHKIPTWQRHLAARPDSSTSVRLPIHDSASHDDSAEVLPVRERENGVLKYKGTADLGMVPAHHALFRTGLTILSDSAAGCFNAARRGDSRIRSELGA